MSNLMIRCTFPAQILQEPLLYNLGRDFHVVPNIRGAEIGDDRGWMDLELEGEPGEIERVVEYLRSRGVDVQGRTDTNTPG